MTTFRRNENFIIFDSETAGGLDNPLVYDSGIKVMNRKGEEFENLSLVIYDIYAGQRELMKTAYYAEKLPKYEEKLKSGERKMVTFYTARKIITELMEKYNTNIVYAYNMNFDRRAVNNTQRFTTENKYKYFFPYGTEFRCIWSMACQLLLARPSYIKYALKNNFVSEKGNILTNAECCYRYLTKDPTFEEEHQGLDDVNIEAQILLACFRQHKKYDPKPYQACWRLVQNKREEMENKAYLKEIEKLLAELG